MNRNHLRWYWQLIIPLQDHVTITWFSATRLSSFNFGKSWIEDVCLGGQKAVSWTMEVQRMTMGIMIGTWEDDGANPFKGRQLCRRLPTPFMPCSYMQYVSLTRLPFHMQYPVIVTIHCTRRWDGGSGFHTSSHAKHGDAQANFAILFTSHAIS